ncbi:MAG TPA: molybdopterin molybdenumtransferase MoeA [Elusimicrobia bacterium]|nr:molybdopterin molybdenumtransferase MoeA [Elusimicrobiota bacterium]
MIEFEQARREVLKRARPLGTQRVPVARCLGRVLARIVRSPLDLPPFDRSAMDGYALGVPAKTLLCVGGIGAGERFFRTVRRGECVRIMTGAPLPRGADRVVKVEDTDGWKPAGARVVLRALPSKEQNVRRRAEELRRGAPVLERGRLIRGPEAALLASLGFAQAEFYRLPRVSVLCTGDEVVEPGRRLRPGAVYNGNGPMLCALLSAAGFPSRYLGVVRDEPKALKRKVAEGLRGDVLLVNGGVSAGKFDLVPSTLAAAGVRKVFHKVRVKPGKPLFFGMRGKTLVFGMPGNPVSTFTSFTLFVMPALRGLSGLPSGLKTLQAPLAGAIRHETGRLDFVPARMEGEGVRPVQGYRGSADIASLSKADRFVMASGERASFGRGTLVDVLPW